MSSTKISWEIVLAGLAFIGIGIYLLNNNSQQETTASASAWNSQSEAPQPSADSNLPGAIVIDLNNLESLENLKELHNLNNLEDLRHLEINLKNLDSVVKKHTQEGMVKESLDKNLQKLEKELQKIENADFKVKLQDQKIYINKDYDVDVAEWTEVNAGEYVFRETFDVADMEALDLQLDFGNLNIVGSNELTQGEIMLRANGNVSNSSIFAKQLNIQKQMNTPDALFRVQPVDGSNISDQINLEATLTIPRNVKISANTSGGHINASNLESDQNLQTSGGHISLNSLSGQTVAKTKGGHITSDQISGSMTVSTGGGHIKINDSDGELSAETGGGHIEIENSSGNITARTTGGNISASVQQLSDSLKLQTSAGNVSLILPRDIGADLDISGSSVDISDTFSFEGTKNRGNISGSVNGGGVSVVINCGFGNVNIDSH